MVDRSQLRDSPERRGIATGQFELRDMGGRLTLTGYAAVFNKSYDVYGGPPMGWTETVDSQAFDVTLGGRPDLHLLVNHTGMPLARTKSGTLKLATDGTGLHVEADLDPADPDVLRLRPKMARGDMDEMSFAFRVKSDEWNDDYSERTLLEVSLHKGDVSVVNFGANPATSAELNSAADALEFLAALDPETAMAELRSDGAPDLDRLTRARDNVLALHRAAVPQPKKSPLLSRMAARALEDAAGADGDPLALPAFIPSHSTETVDGAFDRRAAVDAARADQMVLRYMHAYVNPDADPTYSTSYRFAHHEPRIGAPANLGAVRRALAELPDAGLDGDAHASVERHLRRHLTDAG